MKVSKLLVLGMLVVSLCMAVPATAAVSSLIMTFGVEEDATTIDGTVHYYIVLTNQSLPGAVSATVDVTFSPPSATGANGVYGTPILIDDAVNVPVGTAIAYTWDGSGSTTAIPVLAYDLGSIPLNQGVTVAYALAEFDGQYNDTPPYDAIDARNIPVGVYTPDINIEKVGSILAFCEGDDPNVVYTYTVENTGDEPLTDVNIVDSLCSPVELISNGNSDPNLDVGETWTYECEMQVTGNTLNLVTVDAIGLFTGAEVSDANAWEVLESPPPVVTVSPAEATICDANDQKFCADVIGGVGPFTYSWTLDGEPIIADTNCITVSAPGVYCVTVLDTETGCDANDCGTLSTVDAPECSIDSGPRSLCDDQIGLPQTYCTLAVADGYLWEIIDGNATIDGNDYDPCVDVIPNSLGTIVLKLTLSNNVPGDGVCESDCQISIKVEECGGGYCTFTQGFYGNAGGTACDGMTTTEIINAVLGDGVVAGILGQRSILFTSAEDIILRLPCGGTPRALPEDLNVDANDTPALKAAKLLKGKDDRINNTLVGQVVALTLNMRLSTIPCLDADGFDQPLGGYVFPEADYICVQKGEDGCIMRYAIPESLQGLSVDALLETANMALAGDEELVDGAYAGASFVNELFDECMTIVTCPDIDEICDNDCDDDFDGLTDLNDPDCAI